MTASQEKVELITKNCENPSVIQHNTWFFIKSENMLPDAAYNKAVNLSKKLRKERLEANL